MIFKRFNCLFFDSISPYLSRGHEFAVSDRPDPVIHSLPSNIIPPVTPQILTQYETDGFLHWKSFFEPMEIADIQKFSLDTLSSFDHKLRRQMIPEIVLEPGVDDIDPNSPISASFIRSIFAVHKLFPQFLQLASHPKLLALAKSILGSDVYIHQSRLNFKPGIHGKEFQWHSDFETWCSEDLMPRPRAFSISIPLTTNYTFNGPLLVIPGSHKKYVACAGETPKENYKNSLRSQQLGVPSDLILTELADEFGLVDVPAQVGDIIAFDCNLMHGSNSNITPFPRSNVFFVYNSVENRLSDNVPSKIRRPEFIAHRKFTPTLSSE